MQVLQDPDVGSFCSVTQTANNKHNSICSNLYLQKQISKPTQENLHDQLSFQFTFIIPTSLLRLHLNIMCYSKFFKANDIQVWDIHNIHFPSRCCMLLFFFFFKAQTQSLRITFQYSNDCNDLSSQDTRRNT